MPAKPIAHIPPPDLLTLAEYAAARRSSVETARREIKSGRVRLTRIGRRVYVARAELERLIAASTDQGPSAA